MHPSLLLLAAAFTAPPSTPTLEGIAAELDPPAGIFEPLPFSDGERVVWGRRIELQVPEGLAGVELVYPELGTSITAAVDELAVTRLDPGIDGEAALARLGARLVRPLLPRLGLYLVAGAEGEDGLAVAARLSAAGPGHGVVYATPNLYLRHRLHNTPNDPRFSGQWYLERIEILSAWALEEGSAGISIVVVDNGCDLDHPDLVTKMDAGRDVISNNDDPSYVTGEPAAEHGTACAGLAAAATNNGLGIAGACPACRLRCVRLLGADGEYVPLSADVAAFAFALEVDAAVVSNSWGFVDAAPVPAALRDAINEVFDTGRGGKGALVLFAAGNDGREVGAEELLGVRGVLGVGAINNYDEGTQYTNFGAAVDLVAPTGTLATDIAGAGGEDPGDYTARFGGTSSACPVAAGVAGLLASAAPQLTSAKLYEVLIATARPAFYASPDADGHDPIYGYGIIDPAAAVTAVLPPPGPGKKREGGCSAVGPAWLGWGLVAVVIVAVARRRGRDVGRGTASSETTSTCHRSGSVRPRHSSTCACSTPVSSKSSFVLGSASRLRTAPSSTLRLAAKPNSHQLTPPRTPTRSPSRPAAASNHSTPATGCSRPKR